MVNRQRIYLGLAVSAGLCTGIGIFLYLRHRRQAKFTDYKASTATSVLSVLQSGHGKQYTDITSSSLLHTDADGTETVRFPSRGATVELDIPGGGKPLTDAEAIVLTRFLDESKSDIERLHRILTNIANASTFKDSQIYLANAGCIVRLRELLQTANDTTTKCKILLALNNLALNVDTIKYFSGLIPDIINLCLESPSKSMVRLNGLNLLINMSVLDNLHDEYMKNLNDLALLIETTYEYQNEMLLAGKILVNLSTNKSNLEYLLKLTIVEIKTIVTICTPTKKNIEDTASKFEDTLLRYLTFYCNLAEIITIELNQKNSDLCNPTPQRNGSVYLELFDSDKQISIKAILRPQYSSNIVNNEIKRLHRLLETIRQLQFDLNVSLVHDEFDQDNDRHMVNDSSTPKKVSQTIENDPCEDLQNEVNDAFDDDETIHASPSTPSNQSLASFCSAYSTNENNTFTSPEKSTLA